MFGLMKRKKSKNFSFRPTCEECQKYRELISRADKAGDAIVAHVLRQDMVLHVQKEHGTK